MNKKTLRTPGKLTTSLASELESSDLASLVVEACEEGKGTDLTVLSVSEAFGLADYFVIASGRSDRQVQGIANRIIHRAEEAGLKPIAVEGLEKAHWVLIDFGGVIAHVFYESVREMYDLEGLWTNATIVSKRKSGNEDKAA